MDELTAPAECSKCGQVAPREDMFGLEPDLLCEACATRVRTRTAPTPVGRLANTFIGGPTPVTTAVLGASLVLFLAVHVVYRRPESVPDWLLLLGPLGPTGSIGTGEAWRLVTSTLIHGGFLHMFFSGALIWGLGRAVETTRGSLRFVLLFLGSAAFASAAEWYFGTGLGVGLSGVLYALAGYLWMRRKVDGVAAAVLNPSTARLLAVWFVICIVIPGMKIANWAHGGGLAWGLAAGWISLQDRPRRVALGCLLALATLAAAWWVSTGHHLRRGVYVAPPAIEAPAGREHTRRPRTQEDSGRRTVAIRAGGGGERFGREAASVRN